jgi:hypothetical protein
VVGIGEAPVQPLFADLKRRGDRDVQHCATEKDGLEDPAARPAVEQALGGKKEKEVGQDQPDRVDRLGRGDRNPGLRAGISPEEGEDFGGFMVNFSADRRHKIEHVWGQRYELHGAEDRERGHGDQWNFRRRGIAGSGAGQKRRRSDQKGRISMRRRPSGRTAPREGTTAMNTSSARSRSAPTATGRSRRLEGWGQSVEEAVPTLALSRCR